MIWLLACGPPTLDITSDDTGEPVYDTADPGPDSGDTGEPSTWRADLEARRRIWLDDLARPIAECVGRTDSSHPVFRGCYDWHSSVHGNWALLALSRVTGELSYGAEADLAYIEREHEDLVQGALDHENPYGYAWFLVLAREREKQGETDLRAMADDVAAKLWDQMEARVDGMDPEYDNGSWALLNLWLWAQHTEDEAMAEAAERLTRDEIVPLDCPLSDDESVNGFFPPCAMRALLLAHVAPDALDVEVPDWEPVRPGNAHEGGLNFSRSWALLTLAESDDRYGELAMDHLVWHMDRPQYWEENYDAYSHWVPQFGVYALVTSIDGAP
ncbi:MAG: DUF2891 family protein [Proteobacteria bacterium]|nr:DUF2891 family protein [Pseudomonadota bacterium]MCP4921178.1 DUF2891 family protein [Pseudomonadota bacterium]